MGTLTVGGDLTVQGTATVTLTNDDVVVGDLLSLLGTATLTHSATSGAAIRRLAVDADEIFIGSTATVQATGLGWRAATTSGVNAEGWPNGSPTYGSGNQNGGCGGGLGQRYAAGNPICRVHGRYDDASWPGSGGGFSAGGAGGGVIHLEATTSIVVDGDILANGAASGASQGGGGGGGGITLIAPSLSGSTTTGLVSAKGGNATTYSPGGGGRIVVAGYDPATGLGGLFATTPWVNLTAAGGARGTAAYGGAGTIFMLPQGESFGTLTLDNDDQAPAADSTPLETAGAGTILSLTAGAPDDTLVQSSTTWLTPNYFAGTALRPDIADNATATLTDDTFKWVTSNLNDRLTAPGISAVAAAGDSWRQLARCRGRRPARGARSRPGPRQR